ncbi:MAG: NADP-dependent oxidoreductase [Deltaproteobacteria bacterium]|nr:NADP-dependent oxidoreductase [Deltaproteobacteria bacterium]
MSETNRQWLLHARPVGMVKESDFELRTSPMPKPGDGQVLVRTRWLAFEPAMRGWMVDRPNYIPPVGIGEVMRGMAVGEVVESNLDGYAPGDRVSGMLGWQEWALGDGALRKLPEGTDPRLALSVLGLTGITAYFGLLEVGQLKEGDVVVISGAAGATGSVAGQIAKRKGCRVVGIAGGAEKCSWLTDKAGFDAAIDYKNEDVGARLSELCPDGIDVFFDNVGGPILDEVLARIARGARVVICGAISRYNEEEAPPGPRNYYRIVAQRARMEGFVVIDFLARAAEAAAELTKWVAEGSIVWEADVQKGFENAPRTLQRLYTGANFGKQLLEL